MISMINKDQSEIPVKWDTLPLRLLCLKTTMTDPRKNPESPFEYVDVSALSNELWKITTTTPHRGATAPSRARKHVRAHDVIFATVRPTLKRVAIVPDYLDGQIVSTAFCVLRADLTKANPHFIYYSLLTDDFIGRMENLQRGASYPAVADSDVFEQEISVPPLPEQRAIADVLSKIQAAMGVQDKIVAILKELKAATMARLFREGLRGEPLKQTEIGEMPESWVIKRFGDFATLQRGYDLPVHQRSSGNVPVIGSNGVVGYHDKAMVKGPGVCTGRSGTMGLSFYCETDFWPLNTSLFVVDFHGNDRLFTHYFFERFDFQRFAAGVSVPTLNRNLVHEAVIAVPKLEDQTRIARTLRDIDTTITLAEKRRTVLKSIFSAMLRLLMTGQVRVTGLMQVKG